MTNQVGDSTGARAIVIFDSRYGNTERIARSLESGLKQAGIDATCSNTREITPESLNEYDLIAIGAPTEKITASKSIKEFLEKLSTTSLSGKLGFAFDTKLPFPLSGSAAKYIEKKLEHIGLQMILPHSSAIVASQKESTGGVKLKEGEDKRFEQFGLELGKALLSKQRKMIPT